VDFEVFLQQWHSDRAAVRNPIVAKSPLTTKPQISIYGIFLEGHRGGERLNKTGT